MVAKRYGKLPSEVLRVGDSLDVMCAEFALGYESYLKEAAQAEAEGRPAPVKYSEDELKAMVNAVKMRGKPNESGTKTNKK